MVYLVLAGFLSIVLALFLELRRLRVARSARRECLLALTDSIGYESYIDRKGETKEGVEKIRRFLPVIRQLDAVLLRYATEEFEPLEVFARREVARFDYNNLCRLLNDLCDDSSVTVARLKALVPLSAEIDHAMTEAYGRELPPEFISLKSFLDAQIMSEGDIPAFAFA